MADGSDQNVCAQGNGLGAPSSAADTISGSSQEPPYRPGALSRMVPHGERVKAEFLGPSGHLFGDAACRSGSPDLAT